MIFKLRSGFVRPIEPPRPVHIIEDGFRGPTERFKDRNRDAASRGGAHRDVAAFLSAELRDELEGRRETVREILAGPPSMSAAGADADSTSTTAVLERVLDRRRRDAPSRREPPREDATDGAGTEVGVGTLLERPLLGRGRKG